MAEVAQGEELVPAPRFAKADRFPGGDEALTIGPLTIDPAGRQVAVKGESMSLTAREFDLLLHFARHPGRVFSRAQLLDSVWGYGHDGYEHTVNSHINRLRAKIEPDPAHPEFIVTIWGVGYKLDRKPPLSNPKCGMITVIPPASSRTKRSVLSNSSSNTTSNPTTNPGTERRFGDNPSYSDVHYIPFATYIGRAY